MGFQPNGEMNSESEQGKIEREIGRLYRDALINPIADNMSAVHSADRH